eukprot:751232-Hanusia_phi.AAC.2
MARGFKSLNGYTNHPPPARPERLGGPSVLYRVQAGCIACTVRSHPGPLGPVRPSAAASDESLSGHSYRGGARGLEVAKVTT